MSVDSNKCESLSGISHPPRLVFNPWLFRNVQGVPIFRFAELCCSLFQEIAQILGPSACLRVLIAYAVLQIRAACLNKLTM
jgi:hypothetical protein